MEKNQAILIVAIAAILVAAAVVAVMLLNNNGNNGSDDKDVVDKITDPTNNITVFDGKFPSGTVLETSKLSGSERESVLSEIPSEIKIDADTAVVYSILAKKNGNVVKPESLLEIVMDNVFTEDTSVYSVNDGKVIELYSYKYKNELRFHSNDLGNFVISKKVTETVTVAVTGQNTTVSVNGNASVSSYSG
ncbi:MAG: hypothetical protein IKR87_01010, partial [Candidatus Methanomethylophilaceae archaeon]|nr:hypothetical protein [Candidatus Methanomethylophilaceae archaeon]